MSPEVILVQSLSPGVPVSADVPSKRPTAFVTVERVGGPAHGLWDSPLVAVQCWSSSRLGALQLAELVADQIRGLAVTHPNVARATVASVYNNPDPDSGQARYQINAELVTT